MFVLPMNRRLSDNIIDSTTCFNQICTFIYCSQKLSKLCTDCCLHVARATFEHKDVIDTLLQAGREFCACLHKNIMPPPTRQSIAKAVTDGEALGLIRNVC